MENLGFKKHGWKLLLICSLKGVLALGILWFSIWYALSKSAPDTNSADTFSFTWKLGAAVSLVIVIYWCWRFKRVYALLQRGVPIWGTVVKYGVFRAYGQKDAIIEYVVDGTRYTTKMPSVIPGPSLIGSRQLILYDKLSPSHAAMADPILDARSFVEAQLIANKTNPRSSKHP